MAFALGNVLQQKDTLETSAGAKDPHFLVQILREPVWLAGLSAQALGWVLQAVALDKGPLSVVQSITTISIVIALPFGVWLTDQKLSPKVILGAAAAVIGIVLFLSVGAHKGGTSQPSALAWWIAGLVTLVVVVVIAAVGRRHSGATAALLLGAAAGFLFALRAAVTKVFVTEVDHGVVNPLEHWPAYVLALSAIGGLVLQQSALKTDVLAREPTRFVWPTSGTLHRPKLTSGAVSYLKRSVADLRGSRRVVGRVDAPLSVGAVRSAWRLLVRERLEGDVGSSSARPLLGVGAVVEKFAVDGVVGFGFGLEDLGHVVPGRLEVMVAALGLDR